MSNLQNIAQPAMPGYGFTSANNVARPHINRVKAKLEFYSNQTEQLFQTNSELLLATQLVRAYSREDSEYYYQMYLWLNARYGFVLGNALTFIPRAI